MRFPAIPLPIGSFKRREGYETYEDWHQHYDTVQGSPPEDVAPYYRVIYRYYASMPRYAFVCPHCNYIICGSTEEGIKSFRNHLLNCSFSKQKERKPLSENL
ncbi:MAG: hypothetical protein LBB40_01650 [Holophagales bacterium]|jgi:hypothetical protein|nr:hypothetical protein [Holophagales bacterium]